MYSIQYNVRYIKMTCYGVRHHITVCLQSITIHLIALHHVLFVNTTYLYMYEHCIYF